MALVKHAPFIQEQKKMEEFVLPMNAMNFKV